MNRKQAIAVIRNLARSQGFYGRLLNAIENFTDEEMKKWNETIENQGFTDDLDLILWLEC